MTAAARISQADIQRTTKAMQAAGVDRFRLVLDLVGGKIEVIIGEGATDSVAANPWDEDLKP